MLAFSWLGTLMDFAALASAHSKIDSARNAAVEAFCYLEYAALLAREAGAEKLAEQINQLGAKALLLDFTIPPPKG